METTYIDYYVPVYYERIPNLEKSGALFAGKVVAKCHRDEIFIQILSSKKMSS